MPKYVLWVQTIAVYLFWPALAVVIWGELNPQPSSLEREFWDKALHFTAYFGMATIAGLALKRGRGILSAIVGLIVMGGALEVVQGMIGRDMSLYDELANSLGAVTGGLLGWAAKALLVKTFLPRSTTPDGPP